MIPTAGTVLGLRKGGNTLMGVKPAGSRAKEAARVGLGTVGNPPPPGLPAAGAPDGTDPGVEDAVIIKPGNKEFHEKPHSYCLIGPNNFWTGLKFFQVDQNFLGKDE